MILICCDSHVKSRRNEKKKKKKKQQKKNLQRIKKIKPFIDNYNQEGIN